jgi:hypothetical protein
MGEPYKSDSCAGCGSYNNRVVFCDECIQKVMLRLKIPKDEAQAVFKEVTDEWLYADYFTAKPEIFKKGASDEGT